MATLKGGLCLILILWTAGSRSRSVPTRSLDASDWWDRASKPIQEQALRYRKTGEYRLAEALYRQGYDEAVRRRDSIAAVKYLVSAGGCQLGEFRYRDALATLLQARTLAEKSGDRADVSGISLNLSSLYTQMWDYSSALRAAEDGLLQVSGLPSDHSLPYLLLQTGRLHAMLADEDPVPYLKRGIEATRVYENLIGLEASGWDWLGGEYLKKQQLEAAENAFSEAFRLRTLFQKEDLGYSYSYLGALRLAQGDTASAERFNIHAMDAAERGAHSWPRYLLLHQKGQIEQKRGNVVAALRNYEAAAENTTKWRLGVIPTKAALAQSNIGIEQDVVRGFAELAAQYAAKTDSIQWAEKAFFAMELNRAVSLRESIALRDVWRERVPARYWEVLARLQNTSLQGGFSGKAADEGRLRLELTEMEAQAGLNFLRKKEEIFLTQTSLIHFRDGLGESELVLSFLLGTQESFLWAVSREGIHLYRLPGEREIAANVRAFREAVRNGTPEAAVLGYVLYRQLFGQLDRTEQAKAKWLFSVEGVLFDVPFAALVAERKGGKPVYLIEKHSVQTVPGAIFVSKHPEPKRGTAGGAVSDSQSQPATFLGVGDAIYNTADSRWSGPRGGAEHQFNRLPASRSEILTSAKAWTSITGPATVLLGTNARRQEFLNALNQFPSVIHLATHVRIPEHRDNGLIAFGLAPGDGRGDPQPEYLDTMRVSSLHVRDALVVMTGCETGAGDAQKGAGLLGLTRAWLMAGATGIVSTAWPVEDTGGEIFSRFYRYLHDYSPAEALQLSQTDMLRAGTWHRHPSYWAAYQVTGGFR